MPVIEASQFRLSCNEAKCRSSGQCGLALSRVISAVGGKDGESADPETDEYIRQAVAACPSGALSFCGRTSGGRVQVRDKDRVRERKFYLP